jgi:hypothetical protein
MHHLRNKTIFYGEALLTPLSNPKLEDLPQSATAHSYPPYWRSFLHPQSEDVPCRGDTEALHGVLPES